MAREPIFDLSKLRVVVGSWPEESNEPLGSGEGNPFSAIEPDIITSSGFIDEGIYCERIYTLRAYGEDPETAFLMSITDGFIVFDISVLSGLADGQSVYVAMHMSGYSGCYLAYEAKAIIVDGFARVVIDAETLHNLVNAWSGPLVEKWEAFEILYHDDPFSRYGYDSPVAWDFSARISWVQTLAELDETPKFWTSFIGTTEVTP